MKAKVIKSFKDLEANVVRDLNEEFEVTKERAKLLISREFVELVQEEKKPKTAKKKETATKKVDNIETATPKA